jgi:WD40 repeat protein
VTLEIGRTIGGLVTTVAVHPKRPLVAAGGDDGRVGLCELAGDRTVLLQYGDGSRVASLAWSQDGARLAAGTEMGAVSFFDLTTGAD